MKFDIYNVTTKQHESGLYADSPIMLHRLYEMNGEKIEILKTYNETPVNDLTGSSTNDILGGIATPVLQATIVSPSVIPVAERLFTDNGIEYKVNNEGLFKKSWIDIKDSSNFRLVTSKGKVKKLNDTKIQTLDWVKIC